jgi:hypothetical protein
LNNVGRRYFDACRFQIKGYNVFFHRKLVVKFNKKKPPTERQTARNPKKPNENKSLFVFKKAAS